MRAMPARTVAIRSPSLGRETKAVAIVLAQIAFWSGVAIAASIPGRVDPAAGGQADEVAFAGLDPDDQRMYRRALDGLAEAEDVRSRTGAWPTVAELAARGIPPFTEDPIDRASYRWELVRDRLTINYVGIPDAPDRPTLVIAAIEPEPGAGELAAVDETHHKLADGTMIHVGVWRGSARSIPAPLAVFPFLDGWRRIASGAAR
jgi:hypothetical protein